MLYVIIMIIFSLDIAISGFFMGYSKAPVAATELTPDYACLPTMAREHATQYIRLVHTDVLFQDVILISGLQLERGVFFAIRWIGSS